MIWETIRLALRSIRRNVLRSVLTLLGIVIGVAAVIAMITIGSGATEKVRSDIAKLGSNLLVVYSGRMPMAGGGPEQRPKELGDREISALNKNLEGARAISGA
jgi:putative ABC transport system permease protein